MDTVCSITSCDKPAKVVAQQWCSMHYARWARHGSPLHVYGLPSDDPVERFSLCVAKQVNGCWEWTGPRDKNGYGRVACQGFRGLAHRYSWQLRYGHFPVLHLLHKCDNPPCVNPDHLREGTQADNLLDMCLKDRHARGERNRHAVLTDEQVLDIRFKYKAGIPRKILTVESGMSRRTVDRIVTHQTWRHLP